MSELKSFLIKNGIKNIDKKSFFEKLNKHFAIQDFDSEIITLFNQKGYEINVTEQFLNIYPYERDFIIDCVINSGIDNEYNNKFIACNKIIFNDDISAITNIIHDKESREDIYFYFDYEKNVMLNQLALRDINYNNLETDYIQHLFLYNNKEKPIKTHVISHIINSKSKEVEKYFLEIINNIFNYWENINSEDIYKFQLVAYLIEKLLHKYEDESDFEKCKPLIQYVNSLYENLTDTFIKNNYFEEILLEKYTNRYLDALD